MWRNVHLWKATRRSRLKTMSALKRMKNAKKTLNHRHKQYMFVKVCASISSWVCKSSVLISWNILDWATQKPDDFVANMRLGLSKWMIQYLLMSFQVWNPIQAESLLNSSCFQVAKHPKDPITLTIAMTILKWDSLAKDMMSYATSGGKETWMDALLLSGSNCYHSLEPSNIPIFCASPHSVQRPVLASINHPNLHKLHATSSYSSENTSKKTMRWRWPKICWPHRRPLANPNTWQPWPHPKIFHFQQRYGSIGHSDHDFHATTFVLPIRYQFNMKSRYGKMRHEASMIAS